MKADATLVNAAFALGRSYVPADYSSIFEKQYEGIIAANAAKYKMYGDIAMSAGNVIGGAIEDYGKRKGLEKAEIEKITEYESYKGLFGPKGEGEGAGEEVSTDPTQVHDDLGEVDAKGRPII